MKQNKFGENVCTINQITLSLRKFAMYSWPLFDIQKQDKQNKIGSLDDNVCMLHNTYKNNRANHCI